ncbi:MAG: zinc-binding dehydrogenase [Clostridia bacterium]
MIAYKHTKKGELTQVTIPYAKVVEPSIAKVRIEKALISYGDCEALASEQTSDFSLGRYAVGSVAELATSQSYLAKSSRVAISSTLYCNDCYNCKSNNKECCIDLKYLSRDYNGIYQNFADLPLDCLYQLPDSVSFTDGLFIEFISLGLNTLDAIKIKKGEHVAIMCDTKLGLLIAQLVLYYGAIPILVQQDEQIINLAKQMGIFYAFNYKSTSEVDKNIFTLTGGRMCEKMIYVRECRYPIKNITNLCAPYSSICLCMCNREKEIFNTAEIVNKNITLVGLNNSLGNFPTAINLLATKQISIGYLIGDTIKMSSLATAMPLITKEQLNTKCMIVEMDL